MDSSSYFIILLASFVILAANCENHHNGTRVHKKRSYVCPPKFVRLSYKCYYFSREPATWQDAYWKCHERRSNLAVIKNGNQDKILRRTLSKNTVEPLERWLGGRYDWEQMTWKWAASGKFISYRGFDDMDDNDKERLRWQCIVLDPELQYKWNSRSCLDKYHYICQTKLKTVSKKGKKKLQKQYNATKYNQLNEVPVPVLPDVTNNIDDVYKKHMEISNSFYDNNNLDNAAAGVRSKPFYRVKKHKKSNDINATTTTNNNNNNNGEDNLKKNQKKNKKKRKNYDEKEDFYQTSNSTMNDMKRKRRNKVKDFSGMKWKSYYDKSTISPLHPRRIIQEFTY